MKKIKKIICVMAASFCWMAPKAIQAQGHYSVVMDKETEHKLIQIIDTKVLPLHKEFPKGHHGQIVDQISQGFLGTPYKAGTLIGDPDTPEKLVVNWKGVDCFTFIDYVQALSHCDSEASFLSNLVNLRYVEGKVDYLHRRHFFTDWFARSPVNAKEVTASISNAYKTVHKTLNIKANGEEYIKGLGSEPRVITYIPGEALTEEIVNRLQTGDYVGVYSPYTGLDVSHVGIVVRHDHQVWFRNASSLKANRKVIDSHFLEYMGHKPGIVVLRSQ